MKKSLLGSLVTLSIACAQTAQPAAPMAQPPTPPPVMQDVPPVAGVPVRQPTIRTALVIRFDGPATQRIPVGTNGINMYRFAIRAERDVQVRLPAFTFASLVSSSGQLGCLASNDGGPNFANFRVMNLGTGETVSGPTSLWQTAGAYRQMLGLSDTMRMRTGEEISFVVRGDVRRTNSSCPFVGQSYMITAGHDGRFFSTDDVRILDEDRDALPEEINGNVEIPGNPFTVTRPELHIGLGSSVASMTVVKRQLNVRSLAITLTASGASDLLVNRLPPIGIGDIGSGRRRSDFTNVVTACTLLDGDTQIGAARVPDSNGQIDYRDLRYAITRGTTRVLTMQCTEDSVVSNLRNGDRYAIGFGGTDGIEAVDSDGNTAFVTVDEALTRQLTTPSVEITVVNSGSLSIGPQPLATGRSVTGGNPWFLVAEYWAQAIIEDQATDRAAVTWNNPTSSDCIYEVGVAHNGILRGHANVSPGMTSVDVDLSTSPLILTSTTSRVQVMVRFNMPQAGTRCAVGTQHQFGLALGVTTGEWDSNYRTVVNLRNTGSISGERIYPAGVVEFGNPVMLVNPGI